MLILLTTILTGCELLNTKPLGTQDAACELRPIRGQCTDIRDFPGPSLVTFQSLCETLIAAEGGGEYLEGEICDTTGSWGGCQSESLDGTLQTNWYFPDDYATLEEAQAECSGDQVWVDPA
jgi:hypothetical protein